MSRAHLLLVCLALALAGCPKSGSRNRAPTSQSVLEDWARTQLDLRTWRSCARSTLELDLADAEILFPVDAAGAVGAVTLEPRGKAHDPGMICLAMELGHPPVNVPATGEAHVVRMKAGSVHEVPDAG